MCAQCREKPCLKSEKNVVRLTKPYMRRIEIPSTVRVPSMSIIAYRMRGTGQGKYVSSLSGSNQITAQNTTPGPTPSTQFHVMSPSLDRVHTHYFCPMKSISVRFWIISWSLPTVGVWCKFLNLQKIYKDTSLKLKNIGLTIKLFRRQLMLLLWFILYNLHRLCIYLRKQNMWHCKSYERHESHKIPISSHECIT